MDIKKLTEESVALLREMVRIPSVTFEEAAVADHISARLTEWGIAHSRVGNNILAFNAKFDPAKPTLALDAHIDTVPAAASYTRDPFDPGTGDTIYGLGSNDDGGSVVAMTAAFRYFYDADLPANLALVLTCEEERAGSHGAALLYASGEEPVCGVLPQDGIGSRNGRGPTQWGGPAAPTPHTPEALAGVKWVIIGEPTGMKAATSERGLLVLDGEAKGVSGHAARNEGVNALYIALDDIKALREHRFSKISPRMGEVKLTVTQINAGTAHNVVPDSCRFVVDVRPTDAYTNEEILAELQALCRSTLTPRSLHNRSSSTPEDSPLAKTAQKLGIETYSSPTTSDWIRIGGREGIKMGPGESARSHHADEYILRSEIQRGVNVYIDFIKTFYGNIME